MTLFLYNLLSPLLFLLFLPKWIWDAALKKKYRKSFISRLRPKKIKREGREVIWLHAASVGETKALSTLLGHIRKKRPEAFLLVTTVTETGQEEAKKCAFEADLITYLPFDFIWIIRPFVRSFSPKLLILVEGEYWLNLLREVKNLGGKVALVSGKLSKRSFKRFDFFRSFAKALFSRIDCYSLKDEEAQRRFLALGVPHEKMRVTGDLKFDLHVRPKGKRPILIEKLKKKIGKRLVLTLGSTHPGEEERILEALAPLMKEQTLLILIVPRHPERFQKVKERFKGPDVEVIDQMGVLSDCYALSNLAIVGGSFVKGVGGHDIFEPMKLGVPTLFGPYMEAQSAHASYATKSEGALQVELKALHDCVRSLLLDLRASEKMGKKAILAAKKMEGSSLRTWNFLQNAISP